MLFFLCYVKNYEKEEVNVSIEREYETTDMKYLNKIIRGCRMKTLEMKNMKDH